MLDLLVLDRDFQINPPRFELVKPLLRAGGDDALLNGGDQVRDRALYFGEFRLKPTKNAVVFFSFLQIHSRVNYHADDVVSQAPIPQEPDKRLLDPVLFDRLLFASTAMLAFSARIVIILFAASAGAAFADHRTSAVSTEELAGQYIVNFRSARTGGASDFFHAILHFVE